MSAFAGFRDHKSFRLKHKARRRWQTQCSLIGVCLLPCRWHALAILWQFKKMGWRSRPQEGSLGQHRCCQIGLSYGGVWKENKGKQDTGSKNHSCTHTQPPFSRAYGELDARNGFWDGGHLRDCVSYGSICCQSPPLKARIGPLSSAHHLLFRIRRDYESENDGPYPGIVFVWSCCRLRC